MLLILDLIIPCSFYACFIESICDTLISKLLFPLNILLTSSYVIEYSPNTKTLPIRNTAWPMDGHLGCLHSPFKMVMNYSEFFLNTKVCPSAVLTRFFVALKSSHSHKFSDSLFYWVHFILKTYYTHIHTYTPFVSK